jgi:hypothetical protein
VFPHDRTEEFAMHPAASTPIPPTAPPDLPADADAIPSDAGMSTAEYAIGTVAACGFAGVLWTVVHSDAVARLMQGVLERALSLGS